MTATIRAARLVVNLHYYENALLEMPRIAECLSLGVPVISESSIDQGDYSEIGTAVTFFAQGDETAMIQAVEAALARPASPEAIATAAEQSSKRFVFMFDRFLMGMGFLPPQACSTLPLPINVSRVVLSLPETVDRRRLYKQNPVGSSVVFDGLRFSPGWVGCGLSYASLARFALQNGVRRLTVMEDDLLVPDDFEERMHIVNAYLDTMAHEWDIFSGLIADLHSEADVISVEHVDGICFVTLNTMTSTVCNIYAETALRLFSKWDAEDHDVEKNTIDRFIERQKALRVVTTLPFLVGHREDVHSTLWGAHCTGYKALIANSEALLRAKVQAFENELKTEMLTS
jgi:hypothetical protein